MSVVDFPVFEPRIWVCDCGCSTFNVLETGDVKCAACEMVSEGHLSGGWLEARKGVAPDEAPVEIVQGNGSVEFARARLRKLAADENAAVVMVALHDGRVSIWADINEDEEQVAWARRRLDDAAAMLKVKA